LTEALTDKRIEKIGGVDVLVASIRGDGRVNNKDLIGLAKKWGVNYLLPIDYEAEDLKKFLDDSDNEGSEAVESLKVEKDNLPDGLEIVVLRNG
jgi:hypothetical protein